MSKELDGILRRAPKATVEEEAIAVVIEQSQSISPQTAAKSKKAVEPEVPLIVTVPDSVKQAVSMMAASQRLTNRSIVLMGLQAVGIDVPDDVMKDRRRAAKECA